MGAEPNQERQWRAGAGDASELAHPLQVIKRQFDHVKVRYRSLHKSTELLLTLFAQANLWMVRRGLSGSLA